MVGFTLFVSWLKDLSNREEKKKSSRSFLGRKFRLSKMVKFFDPDSFREGFLRVKGVKKA